MDNQARGTFGEAGLPVAAAYVGPRGRNRIVWAGVALGGLAGLVLAIDLALGTGGLLANGPLSSAHAVLGDNCAACHTPFEPDGSAKCSLCHERHADAIGAYTFNAHYVYESRDRTRAFGRELETPCAGCHAEHGGRRPGALMTAAGDRCESCHGFGDFDDHPEFDFAAEAIPDDGGLAFTHVRHVDRVLDDRGADDPEAACLTCHAPAGDASGFEPISFAGACRDCHLNGEVESAELPIQRRGTTLVGDGGDGAALTLGVETLETVRERRGPGEQWARRMSAALFEADDGFVVKTDVTHADPWILHNLRRLRRAIYPSGGLADLLVASADVAPADEAELYAEALATLRAEADGLRDQDEDWVHAALLELDRDLGMLEARIADPGTTLNDTRFRFGLRDSRLGDAQLADIDAFARELAEPCVACHTVERATIGRVRQEQSVLRRARFDHRAHVIQRGCLDCHTAIPFAELLGAEGPVDATVDNAAIQNVPGIETCRSCHAPNRASDSCVTCHEFHPNRSARSRLQP